ncbi:MAG: hypothetical protein WBA53_08240 [Burkholderiaceae bacterium]
MRRSGEQGLSGWMLKGIAVVAAALALAACVVYEPVPMAQGPSTYDRSWAAAVGALQDQGMAISEQDRASGVVRGTRGPVTVTALVRTQADGRVRVEFNTTGGADPGLVDRVSESYNRRMGR